MARGGRDDEYRHDSLWWHATTGGKSKHRSAKRDARGFPLFVKGSLGGLATPEQPEAHTEEKKTFEADELNDYNVDTVSEEGSVNPIFGQESGNPLVPGDQEKEIAEQESMSQFYARMTHELSSQNASRQGKELGKSQSVSEESFKSKLRVSSGQRKTTQSAKSNAHWFIRRATETAPSSTHQSNPPANIVSRLHPVQCNVCKMILAPPVSTKDLDAHQSSIGHQISKAEPVSLADEPKRNKSKPAETPKEDTITVLKPGNIGYIALQKMGWRSGMGLGREEWESDQMASLTPLKRSVGNCPPQHALHKSEHTIQESSAAVLSEELPQLHEHHQPVKDTGKVRQTTSDPENPRIRPLLEPIPLHRRLDRRGIGISLPTSARVRDHPRTIQEHEEDLHTKTANSNPRSTKRLRQEQADRERQELKALRQSLNG